MSQKDAGIERYVPIVSGAGLVGVLVSIFLLSDYAGPLMHLAKDLVARLQ